ncbi:hypothetical protein Tsubulata_043765 [Turnera subulata]|uniref:CCHC-type domain-containing protein n=1 Tax=Turnera subulata TaxID=218843 RepID=A0A9Q0JMB3_9ROSI|nr:hypothetical protein Tsubulata_043765 [Turnera subulata]
MSSVREVSPDREICPVLELWKDDNVIPVVESPVLVGRLVADFKRFSTRVIGEALPKIWNLRLPVKVLEVSDNTFVFHFSSLAEKDRVLTSSPWSFGGHFLCLKEWLATVELQAIDFEHVELWVQVSGLPPSQMTHRKATMIGTLFASVVDVDLPVDNSPFWGKFFKMKVLVSTVNPLPTGFLSKSQDDSASWVSFKYVNLVDYCYYCARMGHVEKECPFLSEDKMKGTESSKYGRKTPGKEARDIHQQPKQVEVMDSAGPKVDGSSNGGPVSKEMFSNLVFGREQNQEHAGLACCSMLPTNPQPTPSPQTAQTTHPPGSSKKRLAQPRHSSAKKLKPSLQGPDPLEQGTTQTPLTSLFNSGLGALLTPTPPPSNRLSLKKQARLRASASPVSFPSNEKNLEIEPNASHIKSLYLEVDSSPISESMAVVVGQQPQGQK